MAVCSSVGRLSFRRVRSCTRINPTCPKFDSHPIRRLRTEGYIVIAIIEESPGVDDPTVMARAKQENAILLTFDRDYGELVLRHQLSPPAG